MLKHCQGEKIKEEIIKIFKASEASETSKAEEEEDEQQKFIRYCQLGNLEKVNEYLETSLHYISYALYVASTNGQISIVDRLLQSNCVDPPDKEIFTYNDILIYTISKNYVEIVDLLLKDPRVDPSVNNNQAIRIAKSNDQIEIVDLLIKDPRVDPSSINKQQTRIFSNKKKLKKCI